MATSLCGSHSSAAVILLIAKCYMVARLHAATMAVHYKHYQYARATGREEAAGARRAVAHRSRHAQPPNLLPHQAYRTPKIFQKFPGFSALYNCPRTCHLCPHT